MCATYVRLVLGLAVLALALAIEGPCVYDEKECSCRFGDHNSGICLDLVSGTPSNGVCDTRFCRQGWTCACGNRTHLCSVRTRRAMMPNSDHVPVSSIVDCHQETRNTAADGDQLSLGMFRPGFSALGLETGACSQVAWWLDGALMANFGQLSEPTLSAEMRKRTYNTRLTLRPGSMLAFRFRNASYHCYNSFSSFVVNGTELDTTSANVTTTFARAFTPNWYSPDAAVSFADDERRGSVSDFVPLRTHTLSDGSPIAIGEDSWKPPDGTEDHKISNFYYRIQL